jgi:hypothetical protein
MAKPFAGEQDRLHHPELRRDSCEREHFAIHKREEDGTQSKPQVILIPLLRFPHISS